MSVTTKLHIKAGKERSIERRHPWVFSGAIQKTEGDLKEGQVVEVLSSRGKHLGFGHYQDGSIVVRLLTFDGTLPDAQFYSTRIQSAWNLRTSLGLTNTSSTTIFRLVHGEGDFLPGLIIDYYNGHAIIQCHSIGMYC